MVNTEEFITRLERIIAHYGLTAAAFADQLGVQRSGISHLLSGRNKPSLDFVLRVVKTFPEVNLYWLLNGKGNFPADKGSPTTPNKILSPDPVVESSGSKTIDKIIIFYKDGSFESYQKNLDTNQN
ncbi:helix-turn-helix transcriptional regulator [Zeaxanthinibacter sp. PT1]|uniref:helix-turn-helix transcriptional regulator n=1 Tax=Zeaxanthinibacter TaxID=561554 RepID=UPI00234BAA16|nr:helix-turn-helix transcriptional regulator [Zeaxanthinibacter sp. PT1]MDC6351600.1 helix-turn-helix transcriptional regulator [Zeaxanthinibacter sp. PT1]